MSDALFDGYVRETPDCPCDVRSNVLTALTHHHQHRRHPCMRNHTCNHLFHFFLCSNFSVRFWFWFCWVVIVTYESGLSLAARAGVPLESRSRSRSSSLLQTTYWLPTYFWCRFTGLQASNCTCFKCNQFTHPLARYARKSFISSLLSFISNPCPTTLTAKPAAWARLVTSSLSLSFDRPGSGAGAGFSLEKKNKWSTQWLHNGQRN